jgi:hypothetical protein
MSFAEYLKTEFGIGEPIFIEDVTFENRSRSWVYKELKKLVDQGRLKRFCRGIYYFPKILPWGTESTLSGDKIIERRYIADGKEIYGYVGGFPLLNMAGLTTQVPARGIVISNNANTQGRYVIIGNGKTFIKKSQVTVTKENVKILQFLELMYVVSQAKFDGLSENDIALLKKCADMTNVTKNSVNSYMGAFPQKAINTMLESGVYDALA